MLKINKIMIKIGIEKLRRTIERNPHTHWSSIQILYIWVALILIAAK